MDLIACVGSSGEVYSSLGEDLKVPLSEYDGNIKIGRIEVGCEVFGLN
jgi:hypothetical protein